MKPILKTLPNGLRVLFVPMEDSPAVTAMVLVGVGAEHEKEREHGLAHFLEHMCFKGTARRPDPLAIARELEGMGARTNAFTGRQSTGYWAKVQPRHLPKALDIIADLYLNPTFPTEEMEKEKGVVIEEINMYEDMPQYQVDDVFDALLFGETPQGRTIIGTKASVKALARDDLINFRKRNYHSRSTLVVVAGAFNPKDTLAHIQKLFASIPEGKQHPALPAVKQKTASERVAIRHKASEQTHLILGARALPAGHKDEAAQAVLAGVLGGGMSSRLFHLLREQMGACYYVSANALAYGNYGILSVSAGIPAERFEEVIAAITRELKRIQTELVDEKELKIAKNVAASSLVLGLETSQALGNFYGAQEIMRLARKTPREAARTLRAVSAADVRRVAKQLLAPQRLHLAALGPVKKTKSLLLHLS